MKKYNVAVVGASGVVGTEIMKVLEEENFPVAMLKPLASARSAGTQVEFCGNKITIEELTEESFNDVEIALFSAGGSISEKYAPIAAAKGVKVIDNTSFFRMHEDKALVVPECNAHALETYESNIIANPNCSTAQLVVALKPIHDAATIKRIVISTYQAVSGAGKEAIDELAKQTADLLNGKMDVVPEKFTKQIAFNLIPHIDVFFDDGYTKEEMKMIDETKKILEDDSIEVTATTVRVPVFVGHSESVNIETEKKLTAAQVKELMQTAPGIELMDDPQKNVYPTPLDSAGKNPTYVGRIREDNSHPSAINMWIVADNLRKGAALNAVQIAQALVERNLV
jgi:aspartate-semialdehyde dehydrogenase